MDLEKEMRIWVLKYPSQCGSIDEVLPLRDAMIIAKEYAREMYSQNSDKISKLADKIKEIIDDDYTDMRKSNYMEISSIVANLREIAKAPLPKEIEK